jgi:small subunit ribosomal protein S9
MQDEERNEAQEPTGDEAREEAPAEGAPAEGEGAPEGESAPAEGEGAPVEDEGAGDAPAETAPAEGGPAEQPAADAAPPDEGATEDAAPDAAPAAEAPPPERPRRERRKDQKQEEVIPGAHLEPDLVLEEEAREEAPAAEFADVEAAYAEEEAPPEPEPAPEEPQPVAREPIDLAADARYLATGKRKSAVARVILKPGEGVFSINGRHLDQFFPRVKLQRMAMQPLETAGYQSRMDVVAKIHGGGVSSQAGALRHGIARALVEADPNLRLELKRRGFLTRDPRVKERKKAGLKKARKRPQFSKR